MHIKLESHGIFFKNPLHASTEDVKLSMCAHVQLESYSLVHALKNPPTPTSIEDVNMHVK